MQHLIKTVEENYLKKSLPDFRVGDTVKVYSKVQEGEKERLQIFEGVIIRKRGSGTGATFTVRKISYGIGVERIFPLHSPSVDRIEIVTRGRVRRARLYYLRDKIGKGTKIKRRTVVIPEEGIEDSAPETVNNEIKESKN
ncbi:MAG TPA: 50S ribosomal protein L19 [bacterium]